MNRHWSVKWFDNDEEQVEEIVFKTKFAARNFYNEVIRFENYDHVSLWENTQIG